MTTQFTAVILIDERIKGYQTIAESVRDDVKYIVYDVEDKSYPTIIDYMKAKIAALNLTSFTAIGIVEYNENADYYHLFGPSSPSALITSVIHSDPSLQSWMHVKEFISYLNTTYSVQYYDMIACSMYASNDWKYIIDTLSSTSGVQVRASTDKTGSSLLGGDWILESTGTDVNLNGIYFTENIEHFEDVLDITATFTNVVPTPFIPTYGSENGEFLWPRSCRIYNNQIYVADDQNKRIQIFDLSLNYITKFEHRVGGTLYNVTDFVINPTNGRIYFIVGSGSGRINGFDASFNHIFTSPAISYPRSIAIDLSGNLYVSKGYEIVKLNSSCQIIGTYINNNGSGNGQLSNASGMIFDSSNNLWLSDEGPWNSGLNHRIQKFDIDGNFLLSFGSGGSADTSFNIPMYLTLDSEGNVYVPDGRNDRVKKFTSTGTFLMSFGGNTAPSDNNRPEAGKLDYPIGAAVDSNGNVYVVELNNQRLQKFNSAGVTQATRSALTTGSSTAPGYFNLPWDVAVYEPNENVYVVDQGNNRIQKFNASLSFVWSVGSLGSNDSSFNQPRRIAIDTNENIYVTDLNNHKVKVFNSSGVYQRSIGSGFGNGNGQLNNPGGVAVDTSFNVYVSDNNSRIQLFNSSGTYVHSYDIGHVVLDMALDLNRNIYITSSSNVLSVYKFSSATSGSISPILTLSNQGTNIKGISVDLSTNNIITVQDSGTPRFKMYNQAGSLIFSSMLYVNSGQGLYLYNNSNTLYYTDTYSHGLRKVALTGFDITPTYQAISQVTKTFGIDVSFSLTEVMSGISNSSGAYTFSSSSAAVSVAGAVATINAYTPSAITITATQAAATGYYAGSTTFTVLVNRGTPTYQAISQVTKTFGTDASFSLTEVMSGISNSSGAYTFSSSSAAVSVAGAVATINAYTPSAITITASQDASGNYAASSTTFTVLVNRATPTYQAISPVTKTFGTDASFSLSAVMSGISNSSGAYTFSMLGTRILSTDNMNNISGGNFNGGQSQTNLKVAFSGNLIGWDEAGYGTVHLVDISNVVGGTNTPNYVIMFWQDNVITQTNAISDSNVSGSVYTVSFKAGPTVYQIANQATGSTASDGIVFQLIRNNNTVLSSHTYRPGAWSGVQTLTASSFSYTGDGTGNVRVRISTISSSTGRFGGCVDDVVIQTVSNTLPTELSISGDVATINAYTPSAITITAAQDASGNYAASNTTFTVLVNSATPTYQAISQVTKTFGTDASFSLTEVMSGISNSSGAYTFSSSSAAVSVSGAVATINAYTPSAITITASQDASGNYLAGSTTFTVLVNRKTPTYGSFSVPAATYGDASFSIAAYAPTTDSSTVPFTYTSSDPAVATISLDGTVVTVIGQGYTTITASQEASGNYAAGSTTTSFLVNRAAPTFLRSFTIPNKTFGVDTSFSLLALTDGLDNTDGAYSFTSSNAEIVSISGDGITAMILGYTTTTPVTIYVAIDACGNYAAATTSGTVSISRGTPTYQSISQVTKTFGDAAFSLTDIMSGISDSSGAYTFTSSDASAVSIGGVNGDTATILAYTPSAVTITASQAASGNYSSSSTTFSVLVNRKTPTIGTLSLGQLNGYYDISDEFFTLSAPTTDSSAAFAYSSSDTSVAIISDASFSITNLLARYDPSLQANMTVNSGNVSQITNLYGSSSYNLNTISTASPLVTVNSTTMVNCYSSTGFSQSLPISANLTIMMVIHYNPFNASIQDYGTFFQHGDVLTDISIIKKPNTSDQISFTSYSDIYNSLQLTNNTTYIIVGRVTGNTRELWAHSQSGSSTYMTANGVSINPRASATLYIGRGSEASRSYFGEILYYNNAISNEAINMNVTYLRNKWFNVNSSVKYVRFIGNGNTTITASQDICGNYAAGSSSSILRIGATVPTFGTFTVSATTKRYGDAPFTLIPPTSNSNGSFTFTSSDTNVISIVGNTATIINGGTVTITVSQDPSGSFTRKSVSQEFTVNTKSPNLRNFNAVSLPYASGAFSFTPPESDNISTYYQYTVTIGSNIISIPSSGVPNFYMISAGTATVSAYQYGNANYSGETITTTITVTPVTPTNSYSNFSRAFDLGTFAIPAPTTNNTGANITYTSSDTSVVTITDSSATILKVGTSVITARIPAINPFLQSDISAVLTITKGTPTMTGTGLVNRTHTMTTSPYIPTATSTSNGTFTYVSDNSGVVLITDNTTVNIVSLGTANITATISEDTSGNYNSRSLTFTITVVRATSSLSSATFTAPNAMTYGDTPANIVVAPTSNNTTVPIVYSSANTSIATIDPSSGVITAQGSGTVYFIASQAQTSIYNANTRNSSNMIVNRKTVTQTKNAPYTGNTITKYYGDASFQLSTTSESTGSVLFSTNVPGIVSISSPSGTATVSIIGVGTVNITAIQLANSRYSTQNDAVWTLTVEKGTTTLTGLAATLTKNVTNAPFYVSATSASAGTKSYALANPADSSVLTVNSSTGLVTLLSAGTATVVISQAASALYNAPTSVSCVITVTEAGTSLQGETLSSDRVFTNVDMTGASLANSTINNVSFSGATLTNAVMTSATVRNAVMTSATLTSASFANSDISGTNFTSASMTSANMTNTVIANSVMTNAVMTGASMTNATITRSTFTGATVRNVNLTNATLTDSTMTSADLSGSILRAANVSGSNFVGAILANTDLSGAVVTNAVFTNANIRGANITNVTFTPLQKLQLLKNTNNRDIGGIQVSDVSGSVILSAISDTSIAATIPDISNAVVKVVIPTTTTNVGETIPNVVLDTTTSDKFYFPINTDEYFQIEGVKYYVSEGVIKRQSDNETVSVVTYGNRRIWLIAGSVIASVLQLNTISSSTFTVASYKLDTDGPFTITVAPTSNSNAPIVYSSNNPSVATINSSSGIITIHKQGYVNFIATQAETELYEGGSKMSNELFVNKLINFTLTGLNQAILMNTLAALDASAVSLESTDAVAVYYVKQSDIKNVFKFQSDSNDMNEVTATDVKYYVFDRNWPAELKINPLHAMMNKTESENMLGNAETFDDSKMLVKHDFIRYLSLRLFNTIHGVDLLKNEMDLLENSVYGGETNRNNIHGLLGNVSTTSSDETMSYDASGNKYLTNDASGNTNLCRELLRQMVAGAPARFGVITDANTPQSLPFEPDDTINFKVTLQAAPLQNVLTGVTEIPSRSYMIKLIIKSNVTGSNTNTAVVDSEMYPNAYPYSSSVISYEPTSASAAVYNSYSPPAPIPFSRFGFNGWYYTNSSTWVNIAPTVRNHIKWIVPSNHPSSTVANLSYVRVNLKVHNKTTIPYIIVYTQSGSYRKYGLLGGNSSLTNGTKYTFYMNFNSYTREPAVIGYTNVAFSNTSGVGSFLDSEVISSIGIETESNATAGSVEFTLAGIVVGDIVSGFAREKEYGFLADVPTTYP